jgi:hypothetical protein
MLIDEIKKKKVFDEIQRVITAKLVPRPKDCDDDLPHEDTEVHRENEKLFDLVHQWRNRKNKK